MNQHASPLHGLTVVALEHAVAAPFCTRKLADAGARVIKLERPEGDFAREYDKAAQGWSAYFVWLNGGKESVVVDLKQPADVELVRSLIAGADIYVENLGPGVAARYELDADGLRKRHPRLIACSISGYGSSGPLQHRKAYDLLVQAESGLASLTGSPAEAGRVGVSIVDISAGLTAYSSILLALHHRAATGDGATLRVSLFDTISEWMTVPLLQFDCTGIAPQRVGLQHPSIAPYGVFTTQDGDSILISVQNDREWQAFAKHVLGSADWSLSPQFATNVSRVADRSELDARIEQRCRQLATSDLIAALDAARIAYGRLNDVAGLSKHPQLRRAEVAAGDVSIAMPATALQSTPAFERIGRVPQLGEHTSKVKPSR
jgi:crotonobetainyl-CoA:carnitine CoA-transferase CaiB-like acyl-CoA transferase